MPSGNILKYLGLDELSDEGIVLPLFVHDRDLHTADTEIDWFEEETPTEPREKLQKWLQLLPASIRAQIDAALRQERPFLPPDITPEMMDVKNDIVPTMTQMDILYRCIHFAFQGNELIMAACLAYVVDRATYWWGASKALLQVVELIKQADPLVPIAPQIQVRKARVLKDEGDLHGAMKVLNDILQRRQDEPGEWKYVDEDQYFTTKAEIVKIKGHILYNMGLLKESVEPFLQSIHSFASLEKKDDKGIASCLGLLTKCLGKLSLEEFREVQLKFPDCFKKDHPCLESYVQGREAIKHIENLQESLYSSRHLLDADTSLLKYAILSSSLSETYSLLQTILKEMKESLGAHKTINALGSSEQFFEFVRALFMISLALAFSPVQQDRNVAEYIQQLSIELYLHLCNHNKVQRVARLSHSAKSVKLINTSLTVLGLPCLLGVLNEKVGKPKISDESWSSEKQGCLTNLQVPEPEAVNRGDPTHASGSDELQTNAPLGDQDRGPANLNLSVNKGPSVTETSDAKHALNQGLPETDGLNDQSTFAFKLKGTKELFSTVDTSELEQKRNENLRKDKTFRGWTYNFGHETRKDANVNQQECRTYPLINHGKPLDPKKQWQTYKHKCVGLPVDPNFFASPVPSYERLQECEAEISSNEEYSGPTPLVNLSVPYIKQTLENRTKTNENVPLTNYKSLVNRENTTVLSTTSASSTERFPLHPHDLPNQPMKHEPGNRTDEAHGDANSSAFSPLVDLFKTTMSDVLDVNLGSSVSTTDPVEYINSWQPPPSEGVSEGSSIRRAFVLNFNPTTSVWTSQSTLAFLGDNLELSEDKKGNCRDAFHVQFLHQDEPRGRYVGKRYRNGRHHHPKRYMQDVVCQMMAGYYVTKFNEATQNYKRDIQVQFLPASHLQLLTSSGDLEDCINVEPYLHGDFIKLTNNFAFADKEHHEQELATALSHFSYWKSQGTLMIVDIQGWLPREGSGVIYLTDPQFHTVGLEKFSPFDYQEKGIKKFWEKVHPHCNEICRAIGLERPGE